MQHINSSEFHIDEKNGLIVTIGNFDGLHKGHMALIEKTKQIAIETGSKSAILTFNPHPMFVLKNMEFKGLIMSYEEKLSVIKELGIDYYIEYPFDLQLKDLNPEQFLKQVLIDKLSVKALVLGENYHFGKNGAGNINYLKRAADKGDFELFVVDTVMINGAMVSSSNIRKLLIDKKIEDANEFLSREFFVIGKVVKGKEYGRTIGFPTINVMTDSIKLLPPNGVYISKTIIDGKIYEGVTNVGINPTFLGSIRVIETHLFGFSEFIYGKTVKTLFLKWIREEVKFNSASDLKMHIAEDAKIAENYFSN